MARKKKTNSNKKLDAADYFEWKLELSKINEAKLKKKIKDLEFSNLAKELESARLKAQVLELKASKFKESLSEYSDVVKKAENDYQTYKGRLEEKVGVSLSNSVINELTYEIVPLEDNN